MKYSAVYESGDGDAKPTNVQAGSRYEEINTKKIFRWQPDKSTEYDADATLVEAVSLDQTDSMGYDVRAQQILAGHPLVGKVLTGFSMRITKSSGYNGKGVPIFCLFDSTGNIKHCFGSVDLGDLPDHNNSPDSYETHTFNNITKNHTHPNGQDNRTMGTGSNQRERVGQKFTNASHPLIGKSPTKVTFWAHEDGTASGTIGCQIIDSDYTTVRETSSTTINPASPRFKDQSDGWTKMEFTFAGTTELEVNDSIVITGSSLAGIGVNCHSNECDVLNADTDAHAQTVMRLSTGTWSSPMVGATNSDMKYIVEYDESSVSDRTVVAGDMIGCTVDTTGSGYPSRIQIRQAGSNVTSNSQAGKVNRVNFSDSFVPASSGNQDIWYKATYSEDTWTEKGTA